MPCAGRSHTGLHLRSTHGPLRRLWPHTRPRMDSKWSWWCGPKRKLSHTSGLAFIRQTSACTSLLHAGSQTASWVPELAGALSRARVQGPLTPERLCRPICVASVCRAGPPLEGRAGQGGEHTQHAVWRGTGKTEPFCNSVSVWAASLLPWWSQLASLCCLCL